jgi:hypothetical protein
MTIERKELLPQLLAQTLSAVFCALLIIGPKVATAADRPNIVIILANSSGFYERPSRIAKVVVNKSTGAR